LFQTYGVALQCGGDDQWSNILAGADLIRRKEQKPAFAMTFQLLTTSEGIKMGKTQKGALWLDREKTSPYEFYQYWRNINDADVEKCLKLLTFVELEEIYELCKYQDERINKAKERLAFEVTKIVHSEQDAIEAQNASRAAFVTGDSENMPQVEIEKGINQVVDIMVAINIAKSKGEAKRLIEGGGIRIGDNKINDIAASVSDEELANGIVLHKGKKVHIKISVK
ncbi:MAG TPA: tyrosine--tRNA ligase, partial [Clostridia bacterium]|nr:tyrosine--tRNA ligase [Clostridia bacterium]